MTNIDVWSSIAYENYEDLEEYRLQKENIGNTIQALGQQNFCIPRHFGYCKAFKSDYSWYLEKHITRIVKLYEFPVFFVLASKNGSLTDADFPYFDIGVGQLKELRKALNWGLPILITDAHAHPDSYTYLASDYQALHIAVNDCDLLADKYLELNHEWFTKYVTFSKSSIDDFSGDTSRLVDITIDEDNDSTLLSDYRNVYENEVYSKKYISKYFDGLTTHNHKFAKEAVPEDTISEEEEIVALIKKSRDQIESVSTQT